MSQTPLSSQPGMVRDGAGRSLSDNGGMQMHTGGHKDEGALSQKKSRFRDHLAASAGGDARKEAGAKTGAAGASSEADSTSAARTLLFQAAPMPGLLIPHPAQAAPSARSEPPLPNALQDAVLDIARCVAQADRPAPGKAAAAQTLVHLADNPAGLSELRVQVTRAEIRLAVVAEPHLATAPPLASLAQALGQHLSQRFADRRIELFAIAASHPEEEAAHDG